MTRFDGRSLTGPVSLTLWETTLVDRFGRVHTDLRISVTDRCNFRCEYCMPAEGMVWLDRSDVLSFEEIERVARVLVEECGVRTIRLTGGEPTVRARLNILVAKLAALGVELSMTTNGATLAQQADDLRAAGLDRVNISLDSLRADRFQRLTQRDSLDAVLEGIDAAVRVGFQPVKVNAVLMRGINDDEVVDFLRLRPGSRRGHPLHRVHAARRPGRVVGRPGGAPTPRSWPWRPRFRLRPRGAGLEPGRALRLPRRRGEFGVIASVTEPFCASCDRMRLTAEGQLRNCLFALDHIDLRAILRGRRHRRRTGRRRGR